MLELLLLRHAKSRWDQPGADDHDRDLAPRGEAAAPRMGALIASEGLIPDRVLCSTARRAARTWQLASAELEPKPAVAHLREIYLASPTRLLDIVRCQGSSARRLMVVGHNPGLHAFALELAGAGDPDLRARLAKKYPTAALARFAFDGTGWPDLAPRSGMLLGFWCPRDLA
ncbi:MAG TPA: histidine phosphatase family protein [Geminicoccaceae bacterium]|nr:histidine phosphatase family protein [Geminicoccaceae bacterium]